VYTSSGNNRKQERKAKKCRREFKDFITRVREYEYKKQSNLTNAINKQALEEMQQLPF